MRSNVWGMNLFSLGVGGEPDGLAIDLACPT
jgi:hypothetical protein